MAAPLISVVIPTYRRHQPLKRCLAALQRQTVEHALFEVLVVDDGSPEPVEGLLVDAPFQELQIRVFRQTNAGPAAARNRGAREARGALLAFTDDDCQPRPDWLSLLIEGAGHHPGSLIGGSTRNGLDVDLYATTSQLINDIVYEHFNSKPGGATFFASNNMLLPRDDFLRIGGFDEAFPRAGGEDRDFCDRWLAAGLKLHWQPEAVIEHFHAQSLQRFVNLHFRYGQGAWSFQSGREQRGTGSLRDDIGFHRLLPGRIQRRLGRPPGYRRSLQIAAVLLLWQMAYAAGYLREAARRR
jgi:GT2 family glycosyltransferase